MEKNVAPGRVPILQTLRQSPFKGLEKHFKYVKLGLNAFEKTINYYLNEDCQNFQKYAKLVYKSEHAADQIKGNIRNHLPKFIFLPVEKSDFLDLLSEADGILDTAQDVIVLMDIRKTKMPVEFKKGFSELTQKAMETMNTFGSAMELLTFILETSFGGKVRQEIKELIHKIHKLEYESDVIEKKVSKHLFNSNELDPISVLHLLKIVDRIGCIADHAENAADRIRAMLAK